MLYQPTLPTEYTAASPNELSRRISGRRAELGDSLVILGHHYQTDEIIRHADHTGDSLKLSQIAGSLAAGKVKAARYVVFCGVHFMAETADMLTPDSTAVILPDLSAGCSMADMADHADAVEAWAAIHESLSTQGWSGRIIPITYINSSAAIKAFVGDHGGAVCTSSNARRVFEWAIEHGEGTKILFLPDQHLGRNTAAAHGFDARTQTCLFDPRRMRAGEPLGGVTPGQLVRSRVILWAGHCSVHKLFRPEHCDEIEALNTGKPAAEQTRILVHPECCKEVVDRADLSGSTEFIIKTIREAEPGSRWAVGTEVHLVNRLAREAAGRRDGPVHVRILSDCQCLCTTMYRIDQAHLCWVLDHLASGKIVNRISVHEKVRASAMRALDRMLDLAPAVALKD